MNGSASIHDFEIAIAGHTSEDVEAVLPDGRFGAAEETGREMNRAIVEGDRDGLGMGEALGRRLDQSRDRQRLRPKPASCCSAYRLRVPVTVHVAVGTDTPHTHPAADGAAIGAPRIAISACSARWSRNSNEAASISMSARPWCCRKSF